MAESDLSFKKIALAGNRVSWANKSPTPSPSLLQIHRNAFIKQTNNKQKHLNKTKLKYISEFDRKPNNPGSESKRQVKDSRKIPVDSGSLEWEWDQRKFPEYER